MMEKEMQVPIWKKTTLTVKEAAAYSNIGINRIEEMLRDPRCQFVLYVGNKKLVKREMFEEYLKNTLEL
jgi:excisionase family DNA binding protein